MAKIGSPLFILREECAKDLMAVLEKLAQIGYEGIEFLGFFGRKPADIKNELDSCGLAAVGNHVPFDYFAGNTSKVIDEHQEIGCKYITIGAPPADGMPNGLHYTQTIETIEKIGGAMNSAGMKLLYHNHAEELKSRVDGTTILEHIFDDARPDLLCCELDLGWISIGDDDPAFYLRKYKDRCPVIHFKDYIRTEHHSFLFRPTGYGIMNNAHLYDLSLLCNPEWYIMDHDCAYDRDSYFDLKISLDYFKNLMTVVNI
jgi:sugar phosphate isomerase/epimerase